MRLECAADRFTLTAPDLQSRSVLLNHRELKLGPDDDLPPLTGMETPAGDVTFGPATITFLTTPPASTG